MADERYPFLSQFLEKTLPKGVDKTDKTSEAGDLSVLSGEFGDICRAELPERILSCSECPWCQLNHWTHYPELPFWCGWHMDHLIEDNPSCIGFRRGEIIPPKVKTATHEPLRCPTMGDLGEEKKKAKSRKLF
jgi:hypothetical protein